MAVSTDSAGRASSAISASSTMEVSRVAAHFATSSPSPTLVVSLDSEGKGICSLTAHSGRMSTEQLYWACCEVSRGGGHDAG